MSCPPRLKQRTSRLTSRRWTFRPIWRGWRRGRGKQPHVDPDLEGKTAQVPVDAVHAPSSKDSEFESETGDGPLAAWAAGLEGAQSQYGELRRSAGQERHGFSGKWQWHGHREWVRRRPWSRRRRRHGWRSFPRGSERGRLAVVHLLPAAGVLRRSSQGQISGNRVAGRNGYRRWAGGKPCCHQGPRPRLGREGPRAS